MKSCANKALSCSASAAITRCLQGGVARVEVYGLRATKASVSVQVGGVPMTARITDFLKNCVSILSKLWQTCTIDFFFTPPITTYDHCRMSAKRLLVGHPCALAQDFGIGTFYEGALTADYTSDATDDAVHKNILEVGYGK